MRSWQFQLFGVPVSVEPLFWLTALVLGAALPPQLLPLWVPSVFLGVLVHELGHAAVGRYFGQTPEIRLYLMGGVTSCMGRRLAAWPSIWLSLAGPLAGFAFGTALLLASWVIPLDAAPAWLGTLLRFGIVVNFVWGILNLLPVLPLDGGNIMRSLVQLYVLRPAPQLPLQISTGVGAVVAVYAFVMGQPFLAMLFGWLAYTNYQDLQRWAR